ELAAACPQPGLYKLVDEARTPAEALLWCGRARAALDRAIGSLCPPERVFALLQTLRPHLTLGPAEPDAPADETLVAALREVGPELNLAWDQQDPHVYVGRVEVHVERSRSDTLAAVP